MFRNDLHSARAVMTLGASDAVQRVIQMSLGAGAEEERLLLNAVDTNTSTIAHSGHSINIVADRNGNPVPTPTNTNASFNRKEEFFVQLSRGNLRLRRLSWARWV